MIRGAGRVVALASQGTDDVGAQADYRSEQALTVALMGLLAEETVIAQRLARLGRKKPAREMEEEGAA